MKHEINVQEWKPTGSALRECGGIVRGVLCVSTMEAGVVQPRSTSSRGVLEGA